MGTCDIDDNPLDDPDAASGCDGDGPAYMCSDNSPWAVDENLSYGYAAVSIAGGDESSWCCSCFELTFTSGPVAGKKMVVQGVNTGADLSSNQFDLAVRTSLLRVSPSSSFNYLNSSYLDARWWCWNLQWLYQPMGSP